jgi:uncharacterized membrane protein
MWVMKSMKQCNFEAAVLELLKRGIYKVHRRDGLRWHDIHTKFHEDWFRHSGYYLHSLRGCSVGITTGKDLGCVPLRWAHLTWHTRTKFQDDRFRNSSNIKGITSTIWDAVDLMLLMRDIYDLRHWDRLRWHEAYVPSFIKIGSGIQVIMVIMSCIVHIAIVIWCHALVSVGNDFRSGSSSERHQSKHTASRAPQQRLPFRAAKVMRH